MPYVSLNVVRTAAVVGGPIGAYWMFDVPFAGGRALGALIFGVALLLPFYHAWWGGKKLRNVQRFLVAQDYHRAAAELRFVVRDLTVRWGTNDPRTARWKPTLAEVYLKVGDYDGAAIQVLEAQRAPTDIRPSLDLVGESRRVQEMIACRRHDEPIEIWWRGV